MAPRLQTIGQRIKPVAQKRIASNNVSERRITGTTLQNIRLRIWSANPHCACCGRFVSHPDGYELDHIARLEHGGADADSNRQILCVWYDDQGRKAGCHAEKTAGENRER